MIDFIVDGEPQGKQRARTVRNKYTGKVMTYTPQKTKDYENQIKMSYLEEAKGIKATEKPIEIFINAFFKIPKSINKKDLEKILNYEILPTKKPDIDNIAKVVLDALNGVAFKDDSQVVLLIVTKHYAKKPFIMVEFNEVEK